MDVHRFSMVHLIPTFIQRFDSLVFDVTWVVEGRGDEEQPEQVGAAWRMLRVGVGDAPAVPCAELPRDWTPQ